MNLYLFNPKKAKESARKEQKTDDKAVYRQITIDEYLRKVNAKYRQMTIDEYLENKLER